MFVMVPVLNYSNTVISLISNAGYMLIVEKPYASEYLLQNADALNIEVLDNQAVKIFNIENHKLNLVTEKDAVSKLQTENYPLLYSNSEDSINWILNNLTDSNTSRYIRLFKDKTKFREMVSPIFPDFYYKEYEYNELKNVDVGTIPFPVVLKPTVGFLSFGVYTIRNKSDWSTALSDLNNEIITKGGIFNRNVVNSSKFIVEEMIDGDEFAVDAYYNQEGTPVILDIFNHPFVSEEDVSDRLYITSKSIIKNNLKSFKDILYEIGELANVKNFPVHVELRKNKHGTIIPIEVNPLRFAGWCTTDIAWYAYGVNVYEYYFKQLIPNWDDIFADYGDQINYFAMAEVPIDVDKNKIKGFNYEKFLNNFSNIYTIRKIDYNSHPLFAIVFGSTKNLTELDNVMNLNMIDYIEQ